jgi:hypothetical protein
MKMRIGLISSAREDGTQLKDSFPEMTILHGKNIIEFFKLHGHQTLQALVFYNLSEPEKEFPSHLNYIRGKSNFKKVPIALLSEKALFFLKPISDPQVRFYTTEGGLFLVLINFFNAVLEKGKLESLISVQRIEEEFQKTLQDKLGQGTVFVSRQVTSEEARKSFFAQRSGEVSTNLVWMKFSLRILDEGSEVFKSNFVGLSDSELEEAGEKILEKAFEDFQFRLDQSLKDGGAVHFLPSDQLQVMDRSPFLKTSKSNFIVFDSGICSIMMELIRYI